MSRIVKSFRYAFKGILFALRRERNFQIECVVAAIVGILMIVLPLSAGERAILIFAIVGVLSLELVNTALERVMDILKPRVHPYAKVIKDMMAGAVLLTSIAALIIGLIIFSPYLIAL